MPNVTVIIPTYQRCHALRNAVQSVRSQTYKDLEIVIVDDGSTDGTREAVRAWTVEDARIKYFYQANSGPASARNTGLAASLGDYVAFLDSDDEWHRDKLQRQVHLLQENSEVDVAFSDALVVNKATRETYILSARNQHLLRALDTISTRGGPSALKIGGNLAEQLYRKDFVLFSSVISRRAALVGIGGFDFRRKGTEDVDLLVRLANKGGFVYCPEVLVTYHFSPQGISWVGEHWLREQVDYHIACLRSPHYSEFRDLAFKKLKAAFRSLQIHWGRKRAPSKCLGLFRESLRYQFDILLLVYAMLSIFGELPFALVSKCQTLKQRILLTSD